MLSEAPEDDVMRLECYFDDSDDIFEAFNDRESERSTAAIPRTAPFKRDAVGSNREPLWKRAISRQYDFVLCLAISHPRKARKRCARPSVGALN
jgi:hypothetical protein